MRRGAHQLMQRMREPEVARRRRGELLRDRVVREALDGVVVRILEDALRLGGPDDDRLVGAARREPLPVARVRHAVQRVLVPLERVQQVAVDRVVHQDAAADGGDELRAIGLEDDVIDAILDAVALRHLVAPGYDGPHRPR
eukprot:7388538-Prymnesium_polylepis.1